MHALSVSWIHWISREIVFVHPTRLRSSPKIGAGAFPSEPRGSPDEWDPDGTSLTDFY
jgi:hypothetical protein